MKNPKNISRRRFVNLSAQGYAGLQLAGTLPLSLAGVTSCRNDELKTVHGVCYHDCPDSCSWIVTTKKGQIISFEADKKNPFTAGRLCGKMETFPEDITFNPDRVLTPLKRLGKKGEGRFESVSWDQAITEVATRLKDTIAEYGSEAVLPFGYAGTQNLVQNSTMSRRFFTRLGASKLDATICGDTAVAGNLLVNGQTMGILPEDIVHSRYIILWGTNTKLSNVHLWPYILKAREKGGKLVVIDPFRTVTAAEADWHIQPKPGTDVALALGLMHVLIREDLIDRAYVKDYTHGFDQLQEHVRQYDPKSVSQTCGLSEEDVSRLAREYAAGEPSLIRFLVGMEHNSNGGDAFRAISMLPSLTGSWRTLGGGLMHMTYELFGEALNWESIAFSETMESKDVRSINMVQLGRALTNEDMNPAVKALFIFNANPAVTIPDQNRVRQGLSRDDLLTVCLEHFITDTAKYADYIFPATTQLEHWDIADSWGQIYIGLNEPAIEPRGEAKPNTEFFRLLAQEMGYDDPCFSESDLEIAQSLFKTDHPYMENISFDYLRENGWARLQVPEPWLPHAEGNFGTPSGKCEFYSEELAAAGMALPNYKPVNRQAVSAEDYPFHLLTVKSTNDFHNSSHANIPHLVKSEGKPWLNINPIDAREKGLGNGDKVKVFNQYGTVILSTRIDDTMRRGLLAMPQGYWPSLVEGGASANALTNDRLSDLGNGSALHDCQVQVVKA